MCLIVLAWRAHPDYPLIVAANRDEFHRRPASPAAFWEDRPSILAGRDLEAGGTWMGVSRSGRFAAVTNYRGAREPSAPHSRGALVSGFLESRLSPEDFLEDVKPALYSGFNLLVADGGSLWWLSNRGGEARELRPGIYALGNALLDSEDVDGRKPVFEAALRPAPALEPLFAAVGEARIMNSEYGTRCSTVLLRRNDGRTRYAERSFSAAGAEQETVHYAF
jgi:uncharacterized protein with NRDE domain